MCSACAVCVESTWYSSSGGRRPTQRRRWLTGSCTPQAQHPIGQAVQLGPTQSRVIEPASWPASEQVVGHPQCERTRWKRRRRPLASSRRSAFCTPTTRRRTRSYRLPKASVPAFPGTCYAARIAMRRSQHPNPSSSGARARRPVAFETMSFGTGTTPNTHRK